MFVGIASPVRRMLPWIVVSAWLAGMCFAFWYFEFRPQRSFAAPGFATWGNAQQRDVAQRWFRDLRHTTPAPADAGTITVVHVYRESCECNRFTETHLAEIVARFGDHGVRFIRIESNSAAAHGMPNWVASLPAAFVFGADSEMLYFGPYSDAAWCGRSGALVEKVIERALQGVPPQPPATTAWGCFCEPGDKRGMEQS